MQSYVVPNFVIIGKRLDPRIEGRNVRRELNDDDARTVVVSCEIVPHDHTIPSNIQKADATRKHREQTWWLEPPV
jgi:hypothetical protein